MTTLREAAQQALEFIKATNASSSFWLVPESNLNKTVKALRAALEQPEQKAECDGGTCGLGGYCDECPKRQPEQEPVAWMSPASASMIGKTDENGSAYHIITTSKKTANNSVPLFAHPPRREPEQEPVAYLYHDASTPSDAHPWLHSTMLVLAADRRPGLRGETPLFAHPPRNEANHE
jgi:hypothetical protein